MKIGCTGDACKALIQVFFYNVMRDISVFHPISTFDEFFSSEICIISVSEFVLCSASPNGNVGISHGEHINNLD